MLYLLNGLNPLQTNTHCFFKNGREKTDIYLHQYIRNKWNDNLNFSESLNATFLTLIGNHQSFAITDEDCTNESNINNATFKGLLDFLILPLIARRIWNWSFLKQQQKDINFNSIMLELAIFAARIIAIYISLARIIAGIVLTLTLAPIIGLVCLTRSINLGQDMADDNKSEFLPVPPFHHLP